MQGLGVALITEFCEYTLCILVDIYMMRIDMYKGSLIQKCV